MKLGPALALLVSLAAPVPGYADEPASAQSQVPATAPPAPAAATQPPPAPAPVRTNTWILLGLSGVSAVVASVFGALALSAFDGKPTFEQAHLSAENSAQNANVLWGLAGVAAAGAAVCFVLEI